MADVTPPDKPPIEETLEKAGIIGRAVANTAAIELAIYNRTEHSIDNEIYQKIRENKPVSEADLAAAKTKKEEAAKRANTNEDKVLALAKQKLHRVLTQAMGENAQEALSEGRLDAALDTIQNEVFADIRKQGITLKELEEYPDTITAPIVQKFQASVEAYIKPAVPER